jgi:RNA polymerase sigma factor (sigma-70 family)
LKYLADFFPRASAFPVLKVGMMITPDGLTNLVRQAQTGDRLAESELIKRIWPTLEHFAHEFGEFSSGSESVSDLVQEGVLRFWERLQQFRGGDDDESTAAMMYTWLQQLVRRLALNCGEASRAAKRRPNQPILRLGDLFGTSAAAGPFDPAASGPSPSTIARAQEAASRVHSAISGIPDTTDRQIVEMCFVQSLSLRTVADQLQIGYDNVRERYHAALRFLENELGDLQ